MKLGSSLFIYEYVNSSKTAERWKWQYSYMKRTVILYVIVYCCMYRTHIFFFLLFCWCLNNNTLLHIFSVVYTKIQKIKVYTVSCSRIACLAVHPTKISVNFFPFTQFSSNLKLLKCSINWMMVYLSWKMLKKPKSDRINVKQSQVTVTINYFSINTIIPLWCINFLFKASFSSRFGISLFFFWWKSQFLFFRYKVNENTFIITNATML